MPSVKWTDGLCRTSHFLAFTEQPKDGDIFDFENGVVVLKPAETEERKEEIQSLFDRLKKK